MEEIKRNRKKKRSKTQEQKRAQLMKELLDTWVCVRQTYDEEESYYFVKHRLKVEESHTKVEQIILSGDPILDGVYDLNDYDIVKKFNASTHSEILEVRPIQFDLKVGMKPERKIVKSFEELKKYLVEHAYLTEDEIKTYCQSRHRPNGIKEILMDTAP